MKKWIATFIILTAVKMAVAAPRQKPVALQNKLVFTRGNPETVWTMNPDGSGAKRVWRAPQGYGQFGGFNSAGTQALSYNGFNLYLNDLKTGRRRRLFLHSNGWGTYIGSTAFSRDGKRVIFAAGGAPGGVRSSRIYIVDAQRPPKLLSAPSLGGRDDMHEPSLSADGKRVVAWLGTRANTNPEEFTDAWNIWTLGSTGSSLGSSLKQLTSNPAPISQPAPDAEPVYGLSTLDKSPCFSPDGRTIAFVRRTFQRGKGDSNDIYLMDGDGKNLRRVTDYEAPARQADEKEFIQTRYNAISNLVFSASGQQIAFNQTGREAGIYRVNLDGSNLTRLGDGKLVQWGW